MFLLAVLSTAFGGERPGWWASCPMWHMLLLDTPRETYSSRHVRRCRLCLLPHAALLFVCALLQLADQQDVTHVDLSGVCWSLAALDVQLPESLLQQVFGAFMSERILTQVCEV